MNKAIFTLLIALTVSFAQAQPPKYGFSTWTGAPISYQMFDQHDVTIQNINTPADLPGMPAGVITAVYLRYYNNGTTDSVLYHNVKMKIGNTAKNCFCSSPKDTFITGLTTIFYRPTYAFRGGDSTGRWFKFPMDGNFFYDGIQNVVIEISHGDEIGNNYGGINWLSSRFTSQQQRMGGAKDSVWGSTTSLHNLMDIGFDLIPVGVSELSNIRGVGLFPNPSTDGRFNISLDAKQPMKEVSITISDITGREMMSRQYAHPGKSFFEEFNLSGAARGMYFVRIAADGEAISRRVSIQ